MNSREKKKNTTHSIKRKTYTGKTRYYLKAKINLNRDDEHNAVMSYLLMATFNSLCGLSEQNTEALLQ